MSSVRVLPGRLAGARTYLSSVPATARLVWRAGPRLCVAVAALMLLTGVVPAANIIVVSALLETLVAAVGDAGAVAAARPRFVMLLVVLAVMNLVGQTAERLGQALSRLLGTRIGNQVQLLIGSKNAEVDLATFEDAEFHNRMRTVADEAPFRPQQMIEDSASAASLVTTVASLAVILVVWQPWVVLALVVACTATLWVSTKFGSAQVDLVSGRAETERRRYYLTGMLASEQAAKEIRLLNLQSHLLGRLGSILETIYRQDRRLAL